MRVDDPSRLLGETRKRTEKLDKLILQRTLTVLGLTVICVWLLAFAVYLGWHETIDDAVITFAYSQNLVRGEGLVLTSGADRIEASTTFLWMLAVTPVEALGFNSLGVAKVVGIGLAAATLICLAYVPSVVFERRVNPLDLLAPALTAAALPFALWSVSGMENALQSFLLVLALYLTMREANDSEAMPWSAVGFLGVALTRPEGLAYWAAAVTHRGILFALGRRAHTDVVWLGMFVAPYAMYHVWHYAYFSQLVPNTFFAKAGERSFSDLFTYLTSPDDPGFASVRAFLSEYWPLPTFELWGFEPKGTDGWLTLEALMLLVPLLGLCVLGQRGLTHWSLPLGILLVGSAAVVYGGGDWMPFYRFVSPLLPLLYLCVQESVRAFVERVWLIGGLTPRVQRAFKDRRRVERNELGNYEERRLSLHGGLATAPGAAGGGIGSLRPAGMALMALIGLLLLGSTATASLDRAEMVRDRPFWAEYSLVKERAAEIELLADCLGNSAATVLTPDIGAFAYTTDLHVIDIVGLADAYIARNPEGPAFLEYVFETRRPDIIATHAPWFKGVDTDPRLASDYLLYSNHYVEAWRVDFVVWVRADLLVGSPQCR